MPNYTQAGRPISISTPLGPDVLLLEAVSGSEAVSTPFLYRLDLLAEAGTSIAFDQILGQKVTVTFALPDGSSRYLNGVVVRFAQGPQLAGTRGRSTFVRFRAEIAPQFWLLTHGFQSRIFQQMAVPDILQKVLAGLTLSNEIQGTFDPRDFCAQYQESDFDFASRLMEEEGIYYFFKHTESDHQLVLANTPQSHPDVPGPTTLIYETVVGGARPEDRITGWEKIQEIRSGKVTLWDSCFELPGQNLQAQKTILETVQVGTVTHKLKVANDALEIYEYPGRYAQRYDGVAPGGGDQASNLQKIYQDNLRTAAVRMQQETSPAVAVEGESNVRHLVAGHKFSLDRHFDANGSYVLTAVEQGASLGGAYQQDTGDFTYSNKFRCIPAALPCAPGRRTRRPRIEGPQTAVVVGPSGQEIFTDKYGRVKVQFPWDRQGQNDTGSSCWVRVASSWSGKQWGFVQIPRIGQEVVVSFEEGDPDRPLITGSVYNAENMPPYTLPDNMTQSGIISRSTLQGDPDRYNQLRFEDKKGEELVLLHAEKDFQRSVENNDALIVGVDSPDTPDKGDRTVSIFNNESVTIGAGAKKADDGSQTIDVFNSQTLTVGSGKADASSGSQTVSVYKDRTTSIETGNETLTVKQGNRQVDVNTGNDTHNVKKGNRQVTIDMGNDALTIKTGNQTTKLNLGSSTTEAMQGITLKVGSNSIEITQSGITIKGMTVSVQGQVQTQIKGVMCQVNGDAMLQLKGGVTMIN